MEVNGFLFSAAQSRQKNWERDDLALIYSEREAVAAGVFTRNRFKAAPVLLAMDRLRRGTARAVIANAGNANAITGEGGLADARSVSDMVAQALDIPVEEVLTASTGVIGRRMNLQGIRTAVPELIANLGASHLPRVARAIMTTDTVSKISFGQGVLSGAPFKIAGTAKGAGMIRPDMATLLCFLVTDLKAESEFLQEALGEAVESSFHRINLDGDTSTNDTVLVLANGLADNRPPRRGSPESDEVRRILGQVCVDLAKQIVRDAEGATKFVEIRLQGARTAAEARQAAHLISESKLVKTALFGEDANWGRILAALGRSGATCSPDRVDLFVGPVCLVRNGRYQGEAAEKESSQLLKDRNIEVTLDLKEGTGDYSVWTTDLSLDYVRINADYRT